MKRLFLASLVAGSVTFVTAWFARGVYDVIQLDEGVFLVVNADAVPRTIELSFPSGEARVADVDAGGAVHFRVAETGEGAVSVSGDGGPVHEVGYVTSHNALAVLVVQADRVLFSQYHRSP